MKTEKKKKRGVILVLIASQNTQAQRSLAGSLVGRWDFPRTIHFSRSRNVAVGVFFRPYGSIVSAIYIYRLLDWRCFGIGLISYWLRNLARDSHERPL